MNIVRKCFWQRRYFRLLLAGFSLVLWAGIPFLSIAAELSATEYQNIAQEAYVYGFPMIMGYGILYEYNVDKTSKEFKAPFNQISNEARVFTPKDTTITTPNSDTPYSILQMDLRAEPIVLCMPKIEKKRYYSVQLVDMYTDNYGYIGSRTTGNGAGCYLVAGPNWEGKKPEGIDKEFRSETQFSLAVYRTQLFNSGDMDNVKKIQAGYKVQPLSAFMGNTPPPSSPSIEWLKPTPDALKGDFPKFLDFVLRFCPTVGTAAVEKPLRKKFASIGIGPEKQNSFADLPPELKAVLPKVIQQGMETIEKTANNIGKKINGWQVGSATGNRDDYKGNWALRAAAAKLGIYGNDAVEAAYPFTHHDIDGQVLDGSQHNYTLTFAAGQFPPAKAFWSVTMYDSKTQLLIDNPINRYLINSPMLPQMKKNADGSLTLYIQNQSPGKDQESNWLPAPKGPMFIVMRIYWPRTEPPSILPLGGGSWEPPGIVRADLSK